MQSVLPEALHPWLPLITGVVYALVIFAVGWVVAGWARALVARSLERAKVDAALVRFLGDIARYLVLAFAVIAALGEVGVETTSLAGVLAASALAVGMALQGTLGHFASGVLILFFRPFTIGDKITAAGHTGDVLHIGLFATTLGTLSNERIIVPNGAITGGSITNITTMGVIRGTVEVGVAYGSDVGQVMQVLEASASAADCVKAEPGVGIAFVGLGASSIDFAVHCWTDAADYLDMLHNVRRAVYEGLNAAGIDIPFNQIVVHQAD